MNDARVLTAAPGRLALAGAGRRAITAWTVVGYTLLVGLAVFTLIPIVWMVLTALKSPAEVAQIPPTWWPRTWHPENLAAAWNAAPFGRYLANTLLIAVSVTVLEVSTSALAAYAFARLRFRGRDALFLLYLATLMIPRQVTIIPLFILMRELHWVDKYHGLIILPLSGPALATLAVFIMLYQWNNLLWPLVMSNSDATRPIAVGLRVFLGQYGTDWNLLMAASTLAIVPVVGLYLVAQRWFVQGITLSGFGGR